MKPVAFAAFAAAKLFQLWLSVLNVTIKVRVIQVNNANVNTGFDISLHFRIAFTKNINTNEITLVAAAVSKEMLKLAFSFNSNVSVDISVNIRHVWKLVTLIHALFCYITTSIMILSQQKHFPLMIFLHFIQNTSATLSVSFSSVASSVSLPCNIIKPREPVVILISSSCDHHSECSKL